MKINNDYLKQLLEDYFPLHFFALFRAHELYNIEPYIQLLKDPVLDLGCGDGLISKLLFGRVLDFGIDPSETATEKAKQNNSYKTVFCGDAHNIPLEKESLGGIYSNCVFEHIPDIPDLIKEVSRVLKPDAYMVATCNSAYYYTNNPVFNALDKPLLRKIRNIMIEKENKLHNHVSILDVEEYKNIFKDNGMILKEYKYYATKPISSFCSKWDTLSKYDPPNFREIKHRGCLIKYLEFRHKNLASKDTTINKWYEKFKDICYDRNNLNKTGTGLILIAKKL